MSNLVLQQTGFYAMPSGKLFVRIDKAPAPTSAVVILPPFAEEMNKSRHLLSAVMRKLAASGFSCYMLDNYGTGDSEGDLDNATTAIWRADLQQLLAALAANNYSSVSFVAVRFGALQLFDLLNQATLPLPVEQIVFWQPIFDMARFWQQFSRIKVAEVMASGSKSSQQELEQQLAAGQSIEIAGYPISAAFYQSLQGMNTALPALLSGITLSWFETSQLDTIALPVQKMLQQLQQQTNVNFVPLKSEPYWQTTELASADELIATTVRQLSGDNV